MRICHVSVLNPVFHSRIYYKWALSQLQSGHEIGIIAQSQISSTIVPQGIELMPFPTFLRMGLRRLRTHLRIYCGLKKWKADLVVIHTPELLWIVWFMRRTVSFHYDVHEDYHKNILHGKTYPNWMRATLASMVRKLEKRATKRGLTVSYAEACYENVLSLPRDRYLLLENKFSSRGIGKPVIQAPFKKFMLYAGTIAEAWGIWEVLDFWARLNQNTKVPLVVAGHTHYEGLVKEILRFVEKNRLQDQFRLIGGIQYIPYSHIISLIQQATAVTALYHELPQIKGKMPTKFFEAMAFKKPLLFTPIEEWVAVNQTHTIGIPYHIEESSPSEIWVQLQQLEVKVDPGLWSWEEKKLAQFMDQHY
ncbi:MAG: glycosyltransferase, partial [Bacteroidota bacterium]